jgi:hypothetical protein
VGGEIWALAGAAMAPWLTTAAGPILSNLGWRVLRVVPKHTSVPQAVPGSRLSRSARFFKEGWQIAFLRES